MRSSGNDTQRRPFAPNGAPSAYPSAARVMRPYGRPVRAPRRYCVGTTDSEQSLRVAENRLDQSIVADRPDRDTAPRDLFTYLEGDDNR